MSARTESLSGPQAKEFCIRLWFELTIAGRSVWSDDRLDQQAQLAGLKWLNEIQHRVWGAYMRDDGEALPWLIERIKAHCDACPAVEGHVQIALKRSLSAITAGPGC
jgi:hypothetical protein